MKNRIHPIATVTTATGIKGEVRLRPLSRYIDNNLKKNNVLFLGFSPEATENIQLEVIKGMGKKRRFNFEGVDSVNDAERIIGQTVFIKASEDDEINLRKQWVKDRVAPNLFSIFEYISLFDLSFFDIIVSLYFIQIHL